MSQCLMTGCRLVIPAERKALWGDLYECADGEILVFGGNMHNNWPAWESDYPPATDLELQIIVDSKDYTERRGIVTVAASGAHFNESAKKYLGYD